MYDFWYEENRQLRQTIDEYQEIERERERIKEVEEENRIRNMSNYLLQEETDNWLASVEL